MIKKLNYSMLGFYIRYYHPREISNEMLKDVLDKQTI